MKTLFIILLTLGSMSAQAVIIDKFECAIRIDAADADIENRSMLRLNVPREKELPIDIEHDLNKPFFTQSSSSTYGYGRGETSLSHDDWSATIGVNLRYQHRLATVDGVTMGQQNLCMTASKSWCQGDNGHGEFSVCVETVNTCFEQDWTDVSVDPDTGAPVFEDRFLSPVYGRVAPDLEIDYVVSCAYKGTEQYQ